MSYRSQRSRPCRGVTKIDARPILVFVTVATALRVPWLANDEVHSVLRDIWFKADRWETGIYVIMPDHIHLFAWPGKIEHDLDAWIRYWKSLATKRLGSSACSWQQCSFHHTVRSFESAEAKRDYILQNPVRRGLVQKTEDWPYQGEIFRYGEWW
jgi:REP-associated tyrosine transposase